MSEGQDGWNTDTKPRRAIPAITRAARAGRSAPGRWGAFGGLAPARAPVAAGRRIFLIAAVTLVVVTLVAGSTYYALTQRRPAPRASTPIPRMLSLDLTTVGVYCPQSFAWSPDSLSLAMIADTQVCGADGGGGGAPPVGLIIFNARTGAQERRFDITNAMAARGMAPVVTGVAWSRDSSTVYVGMVGNSLTLSHSPPALLVANVRSGASRLTVSAATNALPFGVVWTLNGQPGAIALQQPLAVAESYTLGAGGVTPGQPFPADLSVYTGATSAPGTFSFWQAGTVSPSYQPANEYAPISAPVAIFYDSRVSQVAPDGAAFASGLWLDSRIPAPGAPPFDPALCLTPDSIGIISQTCPTTVAPNPDRALAAVAAAVEAGVQIGGTPNWLSATVAGRPDGALLAALMPDQMVTAQGSPITLTVYSARTGAVVKTFSASQSPTANGLQPSPGAAPIQWSPSGQQLALLNSNDSSITVWDARGLAG